jgi:colicin import membrane protein
MTIPASSPQKAVAKQKTPVGKKPPAPIETSRRFEERMSQIEQEVAAKHTMAALETLQKKVAGAGKAGQTGIPGGKGTEAGSDYAGYIRSRLTDAFRTTIAFQTKNPEVMVRLTIDRTGRVAGIKLERSSHDRIFEDAVINAIVKAEQTFVPPPGGGKFEYSFRFAPEGVSKQ